MDVLATYALAPARPASARGGVKVSDSRRAASDSPELAAATRGSAPEDGPGPRERSLLSLVRDPAAPGGATLPVDEVDPAPPHLGFEHVYSMYFAQVARWARAMGGPSADLEDLCQDVFVTVRRKLPSFDGRNLPGWLYRITQRSVRAHLRKAWIRRALFLSNDEWSSLSENTECVVDELVSKEDHAEFARLLDKLSLPKRTALLLHEVEGKSGEEIAALEGVPVATIYSRIHYAKRELSVLLGKRRKTNAR